MYYGNAHFVSDKNKPASIVAFEDARAAIRASYSGVIYDDQETPSLFRGVATGDQVAYFHDGRTDGICGTLEDGAPVYGLEGSSLRNKDGIWQKPQRHVSAQLIRDKNRVKDGSAFDYRCVGMIPLSGMAMVHSPTAIIDTALPQPQADQSLEWSESITEDGIHVVERRITGQNDKVIWHIDPELNWNATRVEYWSGDRVVFAALNEYEKINGVWVPIKSILDQLDGAVKVAVELQYDEVNSPKIPRDLGPETIGIWTGSPVNVKDESEQLIWDGSGLNTYKDFFDRVAKGELQKDPRIKSQQDAIDEQISKRVVGGRIPQTTAELYGSPYPPLPAVKKLQPNAVAGDARFQQARKKLVAATTIAVDSWDQFVAAFASKYELEPEQVQRCEGILKECKARRAKYLDGIKRKLEETANAKPVNSVEMRLAEEKINVLLKPVDEIFEQLKKRLNKIPTRKQIQAHPNAPASNPARK